MSGFSNFFRQPFLPPLAVAASLALPMAALANPELSCDVYADEAMKEINQANALGCGFSGGAWVADYQAHFNWCASAGVTIMDVSREDQARIAAIQQCKSTKPDPAECDVFAANMVALAKDNQSLGCGFTDSRFDDNYQGHLNWCLSGVSSQDVKDNEAFATVEIAECRDNANVQFQCAFFQGRMLDLVDRFKQSCNTYLAPKDYLQTCKDHNAILQWMDAREADLLGLVNACGG